MSGNYMIEHWQLNEPRKSKVDVEEKKRPGILGSGTFVILPD
jgi:hypothetical protein